MSQRILYILSPGTNISPFDVTIAVDAGYDQVLPFTGIEAKDIIPMVQDAIFCDPRSGLMIPEYLSVAGMSTSRQI